MLIPWPQAAPQLSSSERFSFLSLCLHPAFLSCLLPITVALYHRPQSAVSQGYFSFGGGVLILLGLTYASAVRDQVWARLSPWSLCCSLWADLVLPHMVSHPSEVSPGLHTLKSCNVRSSYHLGLGLLTITSIEVGWPGKYQGRPKARDWKKLQNSITKGMDSGKCLVEPSK